jgi:mono/diheme cytochrome c family protein
VAGKIAHRRDKVLDGLAARRRNVKARRIVSMLAVLAAAPPAAAQENGDPAAGQQLAVRLCSACHIIGAERVGSDVAPPFPVIASDPDMTLTELHAWIGPAHPMLPNLALTPKQIADINAYLDTLRGADVEEAPRVQTGEPPPALERAPPEKLGKPIKPSQ